MIQLLSGLCTQILSGTNAGFHLRAANARTADVPLQAACHIQDVVVLLFVKVDGVSKLQVADASWFVCCGADMAAVEQQSSAHVKQSFWMLLYSKVK